MLISKKNRFRICLIAMNVSCKKFCECNNISNTALSRALSGKLRSKRIDLLIDNTLEIGNNILKKEFKLTLTNNH
jgi:uncharacterized phosphosugar-binding protein